MIILDSVEKTYSSPRVLMSLMPVLKPVLKKVSLTVEPGEIVGVIGKKGAGKTTLLRCIALLERPNLGTIIVNHYSLTNLNATALTLARQSLGYVMQETSLQARQSMSLLESRTVYENIALPLELVELQSYEIEQRVKPLISLVGLTDKMHSYPASLNQTEKKRVALARALVHKPKVLLCDDPTAGVEVKNSHAILQLLKKINENFKMSMLICTQDIDVIKTLCHRVVILHEGEFLEESTTLNLFLQPKTSLAKEWVKASTRLELPAALRRRLKPKPCESSNPVLRLAFTSTTAQETLIAHMVQYYFLTINIMQAHLESLRNETIAIMIIEVIDEHNTLGSALAFLEKQSIFAEVLGYATRTH